MADLVWIMNDAKGPKSYLRLILLLGLIMPVLSIIGWVTNPKFYLSSFLSSDFWIVLLVGYGVGIAIFTAVLILLRILLWILRKI